jgi:DNA-binding transcriptional MocR family regulator
MTEGLDLHLGVDKAAGFVGRALETALREAIRSGRLHPGARLPGSRSLAADLGISRGTVVQAYPQLIAEGWLAGTTGSGTRVADLPGAGSVAGPGEDPSPAAARLAVDLRPGRPDLSSFPRTDWATSVRRALSAAPYEDLDYTEPAGLPVLRGALLEVIAELGAAVPVVEQLAMADLIGRGGYGRHIRRMQLVYRRRRAELAQRLTMPLEGVAAGLHALLPVESAEQERGPDRPGTARRYRPARAARPRLPS